MIAIAALAVAAGTARANNHKAKPAPAKDDAAAGDDAPAADDQAGDKTGDKTGDDKVVMVNAASKLGDMGQ
ncbi:MAG TPA: hypothetical protein VMJ10_20375, partial [Kofleriaceae bacterium]|nr:hypothetical protein [Kofleriaceae bacterium]